jgi:hypothetical protein
MSEKDLPDVREVLGLDPADPKVTKLFGPPYYTEEQVKAYAASVLLSPENVRALIGEVERLREALEKGAEWFEEYADHHQAKGALDKASRNLERANYLRRARQSLQGTGE